MKNLISGNILKYQLIKPTFYYIDSQINYQIHTKILNSFRKGKALTLLSTKIFHYVALVLIWCLVFSTKLQIKIYCETFIFRHLSAVLKMYLPPSEIFYVEKITKTSLEIKVSDENMAVRKLALRIPNCRVKVK